MPNAKRVPFAERGGTWRGVLDLVTGRYPAFLFGGPIGHLLPVFHLHDVAIATLEPALQYLVEEGYQTVTSEAIAHFVLDGVHPGPRSVALCFDDAHASLWCIAHPLLRRYGLQAITYAIPARIANAAATRPTIDETKPVEPIRLDDFVTWPELRAMHAGGFVDVQSHTYSHSSIFCGDIVTGFVTPAYAATHPMSRPLISLAGGEGYLDPKSLGAPLYLQRSRMSDALRYHAPLSARERCMARVKELGGASIFAREGWEAELRSLANLAGVYETGDEQCRAIREELDAGRAVLNDRLRTQSVRHVCFPWGVAGKNALEAVRVLGFRTAFSERPLGLRAVRAGDDPFRLMRLNGRHITRLPRRRRLLVSRGPAGYRSERA